MFVLFFIVHLFFASLFYLLDATIEAIFFVVLGIISVLLFSPFKIFWKEEPHSITSIGDSVGEVKSTVRHTIVSFFSKQALLSSIVMTNIALIGIVYSGKNVFWFGISLAEFLSAFVIFVCVFGIIWVFFDYFQSATFENVIELQVPILGFLLMAAYFFQDGVPDFLYCSAFSWVVVFLGCLIYSREGSKLRRMIYPLVFWLLLYVSMIFWILYFKGSLTWAISGISLFLYSVGFFEWVSLPQFKLFREPIRAVSLLWLYVSTISFGFLLFAGWSYWYVFFLLLSLAFNVYVHARFENYPSLVFSTLIPVPLYYYFFWISENFWSFLISSLLITLGLTFFWRVVRTSYRGDEYVFQSVSMCVLTGNVIYYGWRFGFADVFEYSMLLLLFSFVVFISYLQIRK